MQMVTSKKDIIHGGDALTHGGTSVTLGGDVDGDIHTTSTDTTLIIM